MIENYIEQRDGGYWITGTRVSLDSLVYRWREGLSPETIRECFPVLSLKQVYAAIFFYLDQQATIDEYLNQAEKAEEEMAQKLRSQYPAVHQRTDEIVQAVSTPQT